MKWHLCKDRPGFDPEVDDPWVPEPLAECPYHGQDGRKQLGYRPSRADRAAQDRAAGTVGTDRGGYISG